MPIAEWPAPQNCDGLAGEASALLLEDVGHAVGDPRRGLALADRGQAASAGGIRRRPRAGCVDHGVGTQRLRTLAVLVADLERRRLAALGLRLVEAGTSDGRDSARCADHVAQQGLGRQRLDVPRPIGGVP